MTVTLRRRENGDETLFFERTYEAPAEDYVNESEKVFTDWKDGECIAEVATESGWSATADVTTVTQSPWNYGVQVELSEEVDNLAVFNYHFDPGESYNPNCY